MSAGASSASEARDPSRVPAVLARLRQATRAHHERLERGLSLVDRAPPLTLSEYRRVLEAFLGFHEPVEECLGAIAWPSIGLDFERRRRAHLLRRDLAVLGGEGRAIELVPRCGAIPRPCTPTEGLGCLYVLEGSTLGGQVISRVLSQHLGVSPVSGGAFFHGHGPATSAMWRAFLDHLAAVAPADERTVVDAACATFAALERWLSEQDLLGDRQAAGSVK